MYQKFPKEAVFLLEFTQYKYELGHFKSILVGKEMINWRICESFKTAKKKLGPKSAIRNCYLRDVFADS